MSDVVEPARGGDMTFGPGAGYPRDGHQGGDLVFHAYDEEGDMVDALRFNGDGKVYVRGELVDDNPLIYGAFKAWLGESVATRFGNAEVNIRHEEGKESVIDQLGDLSA